MYKGEMKLSSGKGPLWYSLPPLAECSRTHLYQCTSWWCCERLRLASVDFLFVCFLKTLSVRLPVSWWVIYKCTCPHSTECSAVFDLPVYLVSPRVTFFVSGDEKVLKGKRFADVKEVKQKNGRSTKRYPNWLVQKLVSSGENISVGVLPQMESILKVTEV